MEQQSTPVAQYLRMSSDGQQLSLDSQAAAIQEYAERHGFKVVQSYEDPGKSGLMIENRKGLVSLLNDVLTGNQPYQAILVYDVSRWGRFQDTDEAAHYEFLCRKSGILIYYCAESFPNDGSAPNAIMKTLKRVMAAEYSRELSLRISRAKRIMTERGFWAGSSAGYGLRRMLVDSNGRPKRILEKGDTNSLVGGRVILVPGPTSEVAIVREIFRLTISGYSSKSIARTFNLRHLTCGGHPWHCWRVIAILQNPKYIGCLFWGRKSGILGTKRVRVPPSLWATKAGAFDAIVDENTFEAAQRVIRERTCHRTNDELLDKLSSLLSSRGRLSSLLIDKSPEVPAAGTYVRRFGSINRACQLIGYRQLGNAEPKMNREKTRSRKQTERLRRNVIRQVRQTFHREVWVERSPPGIGRFIVCFDDGVRIPILVCRCVKTPRENDRWVLPWIAPQQGPLVLLCRCTPGNEKIMDFHLVPTATTRRGLRLMPNDPWLKQGKRLQKLSRLHSVALSLKRLTVARGEL